MNILITQGDPKGIGPEVTVKALKKLSPKKREKIILIGEKTHFEKAGWNSNLSALIPVSLINLNKFKNLSEQDAGIISFKSLELAIKLITRKKSAAIVTAPVSKKSWAKARIKHKGHTEYFRHIFKKDLLMCFLKGEINTAILTEHIPLKEVHKHINYKNIISKSIVFIDLIKRKKSPLKIIFTGLNPHCGDGGTIGKEEMDCIIPSIRKLNRMGIKSKGPVNPEDIFKIYDREEFGGAFFMYHDQLLPLVKNMTKINDVIHVTWGLGFVRTSPTHGTAFDIYGKNKADETSMLKAIEEAFSLME